MLENIHLLGNETSSSLVDRIVEILDSRNLGKQISNSIAGYNTFACGEGVPVNDINLRGKEVYVIGQFLNPDFNLRVNEVISTDNTIEEKVKWVEEIKAASSLRVVQFLHILGGISKMHPQEVSIILPNYPNARQDKKFKRGESITAELNASLMKAALGDVNYAGMSSAHLHSEAIEGYVKPGFDEINTQHIFALYFLETFGSLKELVLCAPDEGSMKAVRSLAKSFGIEYVVVNKYRPKDNMAQADDILYSGGSPNELKGKTIIFWDDIIDTAGTLVMANKELMKYGIKDFYAAGTHGLFSPYYIKEDGKIIDINTAENRIKQAGIKVITTDSVPRPESYYKENSDWLIPLTLAPSFANLIQINETGNSFSESQKQLLVDTINGKIHNLQDYIIKAA